MLTMADGRFEFPDRPVALERTDVVLSVAGDRGAAMLQAIALPEQRSLHAGTLVLRAAGSLRVRVVDDGKPVSEARIWLNSVPSNHFFAATHPSDRLWRGWAQSMTTGAMGEATFLLVPVGQVRLLATSSRPAYGVAECLHEGASDAAVTINMRDARDIHVRVVEDGTGQSLPGVRIQLQRARHPSLPPIALDWPVRFSRTDAEGVSRIVGVPDDEPLLVAAYGADWRWPQSGHYARLEPGERDLTVRVPPGRDVKWLIHEDSVSGSVEGTQVTVTGSYRHLRYRRELSAPLGVGRIEGALLIVPDVRQRLGWWVATRSDGMQATLDLRPDGSTPPISFRAPRRVTVHVKDEHGALLGGIGVRAVDVRGRLLSDVVRTSTSGTAIIDGLLVDTEVVVSAIPNAPLIESDRAFVRNGVGVATVDVSRADAEVDIVVPARRTATVRVSVNGVAGFPAEGFLFGVLVHPDTKEPHEPQDATYDPEAGEIHFTMYPAFGRQILQAYLCTPRRAPMLEELKERGPGAALEASFDLEDCYDLTLSWDPAVEVPTPPYVEQLVDGTWEWFRTGVIMPSEVRAGLRVVPAPPGSYRLRSAVAERVTRPVVVGRNAGVATLRLGADLTPDR